MPFNFYHRLNRRQKQVYRQSDQIDQVALPRPEELRTTAAAIERALQDDDRRRVQHLSMRLAVSIVTQLRIPPLEVKVLARRPSHDWGELHGLYEPADNGRTARITVWMRTAKRKQVVAYKTYLRTLMHEIGHHLDYEYFMLEDSFHTEGFYKRENHLYQTLTVAPPDATPEQYELPLGGG